MTTLTKLIGYFALAYIALAALVFVVQRKLIYLPDTRNPNAAAIEAQGLAFWPSRDEYRGFIAAESAQPSRGTVVVFHGNAGSAQDRDYYARALQPLGYRVILAEYPGYGGRAGKAGQAAFVADARQTLALAQDQFGDPVYAWGESLGAGVVTAAVTETEKPIQGIALITPWDSLTAVASTVYWYFPVRWLLLDKYDNTRNLKKFDGPVAVVIAVDDEIIPVRHGQSLFASIAGDKHLWMLDDAGHNSWPVHASALWWHEVANYMSRDRN